MSANACGRMPDARVLLAKKRLVAPARLRGAAKASGSVQAKHGLAPGRGRVKPDAEARVFVLRQARVLAVSRNARRILTLGSGSFFEEQPCQEPLLHFSMFSGFKTVCTQHHR